MSTVKFRLSSKADKVTGKSEVLVRFFHGHIDQYAKTNIFVKPAPKDKNGKEKEEVGCWDSKTCRVKTGNRRGLLTDEVKREQQELEEINSRLDAIGKLIKETFIQDGALKVQHKETWLRDLLNAYNFPHQEEEEKGVLFYLRQYIDIYNETRPIASNKTRSREGHFEVLLRMFHRFLIVRGYDIGITLEEVTGDTLRDFARYLQEEHTFFHIETDEDGNKKTVFTNPRFKQAIQEVPESRLPSARGTNSVNTILRRLRTFFRWAEDQDITENYPFRKYKIPQAVYGTPYLLMPEELGVLFNLDLSDCPRLAVQRDIFVFQCLSGCRVSDLRNLTKDSVTKDQDGGGCLEYIPRKTKEGRPVTVDVPLEAPALSILERYKDLPGPKLLPCISDQKYNYAIKELFTRAGLTRIVTVMDASHNEEKRPLNEVASSHLARRTFIGIQHNETPDPDIIGKMSGHAPGSKSFARYRRISYDLLKKTASSLYKTIK